VKFEVIFLAILGSAVMFNLVLSLRSLLYGKLLYRLFYLPTFDAAYNPKVAVFVPCKGLEDNLASYLEGIVSQDYPDYTVTFITESENDAAVQVIKEITDRFPGSRHLVAGRAEKCCQKNHNLLKAIETDGGSDVYIFADADIRPGPGWIRDLVLPLSRPDIPASTGFRWLTPNHRTLFGSLHSMMSAYICILMASTKGLWGGSMAVKKEVFDRYDVASLWARTVVDDISLTNILVKYRLKRIFVPHCIAVSSNVIESWEGNVEWFTRQLMFLKLYLRSMWCASLIVYSLITVTVAAAFISIIAGIVIAEYAGLARLSAALLLMLLATIGLNKFNYHDRQSYFYWVMLSLLGQYAGFLSLVRSASMWSLEWRRIVYEMARDGTVISVRFLDS
jgi:cellulose synthase/poly-beta-1,6-N-acetylglucosamine synthase-like glycosyltransferase